jgi:hypothetical protein
MQIRASVRRRLKYHHATVVGSNAHPAMELSPVPNTKFAALPLIAEAKKASPTRVLFLGFG